MKYSTSASVLSPHISLTIQGLDLSLKIGGDIEVRKISNFGKIGGNDRNYGNDTSAIEALVSEVMHGCFSTGFI